jgi:hypothetical protein
LIYLFPLALLGYLLGAATLSAQLLLLFGVVITYNYYDVGYIYNDTETIKKEKSPTIRLDPACLEHYRQYKVLVYFVRHLFGLSGLAALLLMRDSISVRQFFIFFASMVLMNLAYYLYNNVRNYTNLIISPILTFLRHAGPLLLVLKVDQYGTLATCVTLAFVLPNFLCWLAKPRFRFLQLQARLENYDKTRAGYFFLAVLVILMTERDDIIVLSILVYFLCLRCTYLIVSFNKDFNDRYLRSVRN